jgi:hypothetical protein
MITPASGGKVDMKHKHENDTRVEFIPDPRRDDPEEGHTGKVIYYTTDGWHRLTWDEPNPNPDFFNTERVFKPEQLRALRRVIEATSTIIVHPHPGEGDDEAISRFLSENGAIEFFDVTNTWEEWE